jgi:hypothetical protein
MTAAENSAARVADARFPDETESDAVKFEKP